jgi:hypothetical protein
MKSLAIIPLFLTPALLLASESPIYKSTDERGRVTYSSEPPINAVDVERLNIEPAPPGAAENSGDRTQRMMDVAKELEQSRLEKEKLREERLAAERQAAREEEQFQRQQDLIDQLGNSYNRGYFWPYRPIHIPRPEHPIEKPLPSRPGAGHSGISLPIHNR